jgi:hypothetical protein
MNAHATFPWSEDALRIYQVDLGRFARSMRKTGRAFTLTDLARRWVRDRLRYGSASGRVVLVSETRPIRFWNPLEAWQPGDWAIFPITLRRYRETRREPRAGEIVKVTGTALTAQIDGEETPRIWGTPAHRDDAEMTRWRELLAPYIRRLRRSPQAHASVDYVLFQRGPHIMSKLLAALRSDGRFIEWEGRWYLRSLIASPDEAQLVTLARTMLSEALSGVRLSEILKAMPLAKVDHAPTLFGFALAMSERPDLFSSVETGRYVRWNLASPPSGDYEAAFAVYDPRTYEVICEPGDPLSPDDVDKLWRLDLLATAVYGLP